MNNTLSDLQFSATLRTIEENISFMQYQISQLQSSVMELNKYNMQLKEEQQILRNSLQRIASKISYSHIDVLGGYQEEDPVPRSG